VYSHHPEHRSEPGIVDVQGATASLGRQEGHPHQRLFRRHPTVVAGLRGGVICEELEKVGVG